MRRGERRHVATVVIAACACLIGESFTAKPLRAADLSEVDRTIRELRETSSHLLEAARQLRSDLDQTLANKDLANRSAPERQIIGADIDMLGVSPDVVQTALRKLIVFRLLACQSETARPSAAFTLLRLQNLLAEGRRQSSESSSVFRHMMLVPVSDLDRRNTAAVKVRLAQLRKARDAMEHAASEALVQLPIDLPDGISARRAAEAAWNVLGTGASAGASGRKRLTVLNGASYRIAAVDTGKDDPDGRHLFYQEEWFQRGPSVIRKRWRIAVDPRSGEHLLVERYPAVELRGTLGELYRQWDQDHLWYVEPLDDESHPPRTGVEATISSLEP